MDFPIFHLDLLGNRMLIAIIAIAHVLINHGLAVGLMPLITFMEWYANKTNNKELDKLAYKILFVAFIITTTVGAMTGVGIWLSVSLVNPYSIASLIRVFFWAWLFEWFIFITEVCLILLYFLSWKKMSGNPISKKKHIYLGVALSVFSWITMAVIVAILGFMMDPGNWLTNKNFLNGVFNPIYLPQLVFRTPMSLCTAGIITAFLTIIFCRKNKILCYNILRLLAIWILFFALLTLIGGYWYYKVVPSTMIDNLAVADLTLKFNQWHDKFLIVVLTTVLIVVVLAQQMIARPQLISTWILIVPVVAIFWMTGTFERVREFIRKPYVIGKYMYANTFRVDDYPMLKKEGIVKHMTYIHPLSKEESKFIVDDTQKQEVQLGKEIFLNTCSRCHTGKGINNVIDKFSAMLGGDAKEFQTDQLADYISAMHIAQPFMPPFPGNDCELQLLAKYIVYIGSNNLPIHGAQRTGVQAFETKNFPILKKCIDKNNSEKK